VMVEEGDERGGIARERWVWALVGLSTDGGEVDIGGTCMGGKLAFFALGVVRIMSPDPVGEEGVEGVAGLPVPSDSGDLSLWGSCELDMSPRSLDYDEVGRRFKSGRCVVQIRFATICARSLGSLTSTEPLCK